MRAASHRKMEMKIAVAVGVTAIFALTAQSALASNDLTGDCRIGTYHLQDGTDVDIGATEGPHLRWRRRDGTTGELTKESDGSWTSTLGWTHRPDGKRVFFSDCASGEINFDGVKGKRIAFDVTETKFQGAGVTLAGRLVMPKGNSRVPIVVLIHGSEHDSARDFYALQRQFPTAGIGAFVYDKRGTGASTGRYTQDYLLLADDAIAAVHEAKRLARGRADRIGYQAGSQGGWVAPLAAKIEPVDFIIVGFGLAVSPLDEDREAIALLLDTLLPRLRRAGAEAAWFVWLGPQWLESLLKRRGFSARESRSVVIDWGASSASPEQLLDKARWYLTEADEDG